ncbi:MAG TPA: CrcB family protein [Acidimicrobiales bacterium]
MTTALAFLAAAAAGALARAAAGRRWNRRDGMPWGTLAVNVSGSFALGLLHHVTPPVITVVGVGGLGALTTFSSFARDVVALADGRKLAMLAAYVAISLGAGITAAALGVALA